MEFCADVKYASPPCTYPYCIKEKSLSLLLNKRNRLWFCTGMFPAILGIPIVNTECKIEGIQKV